ncbi:MAG: response regulator transcription factor [Burkholderiales bacterium]|nr:response regulator transcription factor [Burkholderiales bacterium]
MNKALRVILVDDEPPARARLKELIADCAPQLQAQVVGEAGNGKEALALLESVTADLLLVDIRMPQMSGIEFARHVLALESPPAIVFVTAYDEYAIKAFELRALDYLLKPVRRARLLAALSRARERGAPEREALRGLESAPRKHLSVPQRGRISLVPVTDILYLKAELKYVTIRTAEHEYLLEESLAHLEQEFAEEFVRVHRNCIVAKSRIRGFEKAEVQDNEQGWLVLLDGCAEKLAVSRRQWPLVKGLAAG